MEIEGGIEFKKKYVLLASLNSSFLICSTTTQIEKFETEMTL